MGVFRFEMPARLGAAGSLLLLLVVQQKLCPWPIATREPQPPEEPARDVVPLGADDADAGAPVPAKRPIPPPPLYIVPDAPAPRWAALWSDAAARLAVGWHDGVVSCGPPSPKCEASPALLPPAAPRAWTHLEAFVTEGAVAPPCSPCHPALGTCLVRTGPPTA
ncbi:MAG: hypothetical protein IPM13_07115 [Phycisphaerales bacterium]|nr:hypothetical protein [Phycisphaerales bacterium]